MDDEQIEADITQAPGVCARARDIKGSALILGIGNRLLGDDGAGPCVLESLSGDDRISDDVRLVDGGTLSFTLLPLIEDAALWIVVVYPITRIEGHLRIEAEMQDGVIHQASSSGTMVRGIEIILRGGDPRDAWAFAQRICGCARWCTALPPSARSRTRSIIPSRLMHSLSAT